MIVQLNRIRFWCHLINRIYNKQWQEDHAVERRVNRTPEAVTETEMATKNSDGVRQRILFVSFLLVFSHDLVLDAFYNWFLKVDSCFRLQRHV